MQRQRPARALGAPTAIARASSAAHGGLLQRKCACGGKAGSSGTCAECEEKQLQRKSAGDLAATRAPAIVHDVLRSPGRPLEGPTRRVMEARFGRDFGDVRVHLDGNAARSAQTVSAHAYTV